MFKDTEKELKRIEEELLQDTPDEGTILEDDQVYNADRVDLDPEDLSQALEQPQKEKLTGLVVSALLLTAGILGVLAWWAIRLLG